MKTRKMWLAALVAVAALLAGCDSTSGQGSGDHPGSLRPVVVTLDDGREVQCITWSDLRRGGLSCDWEGAR